MTETTTSPPRTDGFTWATRVVVPLVIAGLAFYAHERLTAVNQLSVLYTIIKNLKGEDPEEALIYLNLAVKLDEIDPQSANQLKSMLLSQTVEKTDQDFASDDPTAESTAMAELNVLQATNASAAQEITRRMFLVVVGTFPSLDDAQKLRQEAVAKGFPGADVFQSPKQGYAVSLGEFSFPQAIAAKKKFEAMPRIDPSSDNIAHLRRPRSGWTLVASGSPPAASAAGDSTSGSASSSAGYAHRTAASRRAFFRRTGLKARSAHSSARQLNSGS